MSRLPRFEDYRYIGTRDDMRFYDTDDDAQAQLLRVRIDEEQLLKDRLLQTFGPDTDAEARNRGFKAVR